MKITALIAVCASGCSFFATQSPRPAPEPPSCSTSSGPPILDGLIGTVAIFTATGFGIASGLTSNEDKKQQYATTTGLMMITGLVTLTSAVVGGVRVRRCNKAHDVASHMQRPQPYHPAPQQPYPPQPYPPQPYPPQPYPPQQPYPQQPQPPPYPQQQQPQPYPPPQPAPPR